VSVPMIFSDLERRDARAKNFWQISVITFVPFDQIEQIRHVTEMGRGVF